MLRIPCPWCGVRDEAEFAYQGDATTRRPPDDGGIDAFFDHVYARPDPKGWHVEWWHHTGGCRQVVQVVRHTVTHRIAWAGTANEAPVVPADER